MNTSDFGLWGLAKEGKLELTIIVGCMTPCVSLDNSGSLWRLGCLEGLSKNSSGAESDGDLKGNLRCGTDKKVKSKID